MNKLNKSLSIGILLMASQSLWAADSLGNASQALKDSGNAVKHGAMATGQLVSGVVAVPLVVAGELGKASGKAGEALMDIATDKQPLEVSDTNVTAAPAPEVAMQGIRVENTNQR